MYTQYYRRETLIMWVVLALFLGIAIGLGIATWIAMSTLQANFIYPAAVGWVWA